MKPGIKATLILLATLILGIGLGYVGHGTWWRYTHHRYDRSHEGGFVERMEHMLRVDSLHADTVRVVLEQHSARFKELNQQQREAMQALMDSLITDLRGLVPDDRLEILQRMRDRGPGWRSKNRSTPNRR